MPAVEVLAASKTYDRVHHVLEDVSLAVEPGEVVVLMGRSGSGKTTLLNLIAGLDRPTTGHVRVAGTDVAALDDEARAAFRLRHVGVVFQRFHLVPELTVEENVRLPMRLAGRSDAAARTRELLGFFGLEAQAKDFPATISGGESQRAAIARALGNEPDVLLADEPTANLDDANARTALAALVDAARKLDTAVLVATHDPMARDVGDRVLQVTGGKVSVQGSGGPGPLEAGQHGDGEAHDS